MHDNKWWWYYLKTFSKPKITFNQLLENEKCYKFGFIYILIPIILYTIMYIFLTIGQGAPSVLTPWLNIPKDIYYSINRFLLAPSFFMAWLLAAAVMQILSRMFNGTGTFEQTLSIMALCVCISMTFSLLHDLPMSFLSAVKIIDAKEHEIAMNSATIWRTLLWFFYSLYFIAFFILFPLCTSVVHKLSKSLSIVIGLISFFVFQIFFLLFNR